MHELTMTPVKRPGPQPPASAPEHERALWWRLQMGLSRAELAEKTGFSASSIQDFEAGVNRTSGQAITASAWRRYRMACAAVAAEIAFDWTQTPRSALPHDDDLDAASE